jgi:hypothetical protein
LNANLLQPLSIGGKRRDAYVKRYYVDTQREVTRKSTEVSLSKFTESTKKRKIGMEKTTLLVTGMSEKELKGFTKAQLLREIGRLQSWLEETDEYPMVSQNDKLPVIRNALIEACTFLFAEDPEISDVLMQEALEEHESSTSLKLRKRELSNQFFSFDGCPSAEAYQFPRYTYEL